MKRATRNADGAAAHLLEAAAMAFPEESAGEVLERLKKHEGALESDVYVVAPGQRLVGLVTLGDLFRVPASEPVARLMRAPPSPVTLQTHQEQVANSALRQHVTAVPVVDEFAHFVGIISARALLEVLRREHVEDLHRMTGIRRGPLGTIIQDVLTLSIYFLAVTWLL